MTVDDVLQPLLGTRVRELPVTLVAVDDVLQPLLEDPSSRHRDQNFDQVAGLCVCVSLSLMLSVCARAHARARDCGCACMCVCVCVQA